MRKKKLISLNFLSAHRFANSLLKVLENGDTPVILPNIAMGTQAKYASLLSHSLDDKSDVDFKTKQHKIDLNQFDNEQEIIFFTSGSTGEEKKVVKTILQIKNEVNVLTELIFSNHNLIERFNSTVSHQHFYGFLFSVIIPWTLGVDFSDKPQLFLEEFGDLNKSFFLVSSPAFLKRLDLEEFQKNIKEKSDIKCLGISSSGGELTNSISKLAFECFEKVPSEIFGSTETGGIGIRTQRFDDNLINLWTLLPKVEICKNDEQEIEIRSPYCSEGKQILMDKIELINDEQFIHLGRKDRIVKIEEKRVSLDEMEIKINELDFVEKSYLFVSETDRQEICCIIVTVDSVQFKPDEKSKLDQEIKNKLLQFFDRTVVPRRIRYMDSIPTNQMGKVDRIKVLESFNE